MSKTDSAEPAEGEGTEGLMRLVDRQREPVDQVSYGRFRQRIISEADNVARLYLEGKKLGQSATREQKEIIEGILAADYEGRTLVELLQNGHDAHDPSRTGGMFEFWLAGDEGEYGVLYVANGGAPLSQAQIAWR
jgi:hypothetical protein